MSSTVENLRQISGAGPLKQMGLLTVVGLSTDLSRVVVDDGTAYISMPCLASYSARAVGDQVLAVQLGGNDWVVLGRIGADDSPIGTVTTDDGDPTGGYWRHVTNAWIYQDHDNRRSLYFDMTGDPIDPVIVAAVDAVSWNGSTPSREFIEVDGARVVQWDYGVDIYNACIATTATAMFLQVTRSEEGGGDGPLPLRLGMTGGLISPPSVDHLWNPGVVLVKGQTVWVPIPAASLSVLANGNRTGFVAYADAGASVMRFETDSRVQIHFG